jgi:orotate phosphoribosyltransferase
MSLIMKEHELRCQSDIVAFVRSHCIQRPKLPMFGKAPGTRYHSQFYLANLTTNGHMLQNVMYMLDFLLRSNNIDINDIQFAGRDWSALPILGAIAYRHPDTNTFIVRRKRKNYGLNNIFEGIPNEKPVVIVDDLCNSTNSFVHCHDTIAAHGVPVHPKIFCVLNKKNQDDEMFQWDKYSHQEAMWCISRDMVI